MTEADQIIAKLGLHPHPEGGWYRQTWVGPDLHIGTNTRASGTAILFLLKAGERSHWHRVDADEIWITSSTKEVLAVTTLDGKPVGDGHPGPLFRRMHALYQEFKRGPMRTAA